MFPLADGRRQSGASSRASELHINKLLTAPPRSRKSNKLPSFKLERKTLSALLCLASAASVIFQEVFQGWPRPPPAHTSLVALPRQVV